MPIIIAIIGAVAPLLLAALGYNAAGAPPPTSKTANIVLNRLKEFGLYVETGWYEVIAFFGNTVMPTVEDGIARVTPYINFVNARFRRFVGIAGLFIFFIFAGVALDEPWLVYLGTIFPVLLLAMVYIPLHSYARHDEPVKKKKVKKESHSSHGGSHGHDDHAEETTVEEKVVEVVPVGVTIARGLSDGIGVVIAILCSIAMMEFGLGGYGWSWVKAGIYVSIYFGFGYFVVSRLYRHKGYAGIAFMFTVATICGAFGLFCRIADKEADNLAARIGLYRTQEQADTDKLNANAATKLVRVLTTTPKYKRASVISPSLWTRLFGSSSSNGKPIAAKLVPKDGETIPPGIYRRVDDFTYKSGKDGGLYLHIAIPDKYGVANEEAEDFYIPFNTEFVSLDIGKTDKGGIKASTGPPHLFKAYPPDGRGWVDDPGNFTPCPDMATPKPEVKVGDEQATLVVPATYENGVLLADTTTGKRLTLNQGDVYSVDVDPQARVKFSNFHPCASAGGLSIWYDPQLDSPFKQGAGGLEFAFDKFDSDPDNRFMPGTHSEFVALRDGDLRFRIVERKGHYTDDDSGYYPVTVKIIRRASEDSNQGGNNSTVAQLR
jgi:hypothetical protein